MITYKLHLLRHGMTQGNLEGRYVGRTDVDLCPQGIDEIKEALSHYEYPYVDQVYCSPLKRARQTADLLYPHTPLTVVDGLMELSLGDFEGQLISELAGTKEFAAWLKDAANNPPPNALETTQEFHTRIYTALHAIFMDMTQNKYIEAAVICHGGVISGLLTQFGLPRAPQTQWRSNNISGFTISMSTQMWMSMGVFEVVGEVGPKSDDVTFVVQQTR